MLRERERERESNCIRVFSQMVQRMRNTCLVIVILGMALSPKGKGELEVGFYDDSCPKAEAIIRSAVVDYLDIDFTLAAGLLRLHFHDCFVQGCDGSVLIAGPNAERKANANTGLRGFSVIEEAKARLEYYCPGVVSCADILAFAARDAVDLSDGPSWTVPAGRRDGRVSLASNVLNLPSPRDSVNIQRKKFAAKGLDEYDLVTLVGAHTIGQTECRFLKYRLYNYTSDGNPDSSIEQSLLNKLRSRCQEDGDDSTLVSLDPGSQLDFGVSFYQNVWNNYGVLESDQRLWNDPIARPIVAKYAGKISGLLGLRFYLAFRSAMVKMSSIEVKTGSQGEIRKVCSRVNY